MAGSQLRRLTRRVDGAASHPRLDEFVVAWLPTALGHAFGKAVARRLIVAGTITVNGRVERRAAVRVSPGDTLCARVDPARLPPKPAATPDTVEVLYEDAWLLAVHKPPGVPSVPTADPRRPSMIALIRTYLERRIAISDAPRAGDQTPYVAVHSRLDRDTSGVMLVVVDRVANASIARQFEAHDVRKVYHALTARPPVVPTSPWSATTPIPSGRTGRDEVAAHTSFRVLESFAHALLVEARLHTGRKHQVRAHLAAHGMPILGDRRYGAPAHDGGATIGRVMLHAAELMLDHPITGAPLRIAAAYPTDFAALLTSQRGSPAQRRSRRQP